MIIGDCPYEDCDDNHWIPCAEKTPCFGKEVCETCGREYWMLHSRILPKAFTLEQFTEKYDVDETTKRITNKIAP